MQVSPLWPGIPADCDVSGYTSEELLWVMRMLNAPRQSLQLLYQLRVDGRSFAMMSDDDLRSFGVDQLLVRQLRNCSRDSLRKTAGELSEQRLAGLGDGYVTLTPKRDFAA